MRECRIILPVLDNAGLFVDEAHAFLTGRILDIAGGYSETRISGAWRADDGTVYRDTSLAYDIGTETPDQEAALRLAAINAGHLARQEAIYFRDRNGDVEIIATKGE